MMRKKVFILLAAIIIASIFPADVMAFSNIDLSRVKFSTGKETLLFEFGKVSIEGELHQICPFTKKEIDKLVKDTLRATGLTELDIKEANDKVEKARRATEFTQEDVERIKENMLVSIETVPAAGEVAALVRMIDSCMKSSSWDDIGTASADLLEKGMTAKVKETASGFVDRTGELGENINKRFEWMERITSIVTFSDMLADAQTHDRQKWQDIAAGAEAKRLLNDFYEALQDNIEIYKQKSDKTGWSIDFSQATNGERVFTFFGVDNNFQYWYLDMTMSQKSTNEFGSVAGEYEGTYTMRAKNIMEGFEANAGEAVKHMGSFGDGVQKFLNKNPEAELTTASVGTATILRTITGSCEATIDEKGKIDLSLHQENDETSVNISGMSAELNLSYDTSDKIENKGTIPFQISANEEEIIVSGVTYKIKGKSELPSGQTLEFSTSLGGGGTAKVGWDDNIWKPWDGTKKTLKFAGE